MDRITNWALEFEDQIAHRLWPTVISGSYYLDVIQIANEAVEAQNSAQSVMAILLYQQMLEEVFHIVDYWCYFEQKMGIYPTEIIYSIPDRLMFGGLIERVRLRQEFPHKLEFLSLAQQLNSECRIPAAHKLVSQGILPSMNKVAENCRAHFNRLVKLYSDTEEHFYERL